MLFCIHCCKAFNLQRSLTVHLRTHINEYPYLCTSCGRGFSEVCLICKKLKILSRNFQNYFGKYIQSYEMHFICSRENLNAIVHLVPAKTITCATFVGALSNLLGAYRGTPLFTPSLIKSRGFHLSKRLSK